MPQKRATYQLTKLPNGNLKVRASIGQFPSGRRYRPSRTFARGTTKREIKSWIDEKRAEFYRKGTVEPSRMRIEDLTAEWLNHKKPSWTQKTYLDCKRMIDRNVIPLLGQKRVQGLTPPNLMTVFTAMSNRGLASRSIELCFRHVNAMLEYAEACDYIASNPAKKLKRNLPGKKRQRGIRVLDREQFRKFSETSKQPKYARFSFLFLFLFTTGLRIGEALALKWDDVQDGYIYVNKSLADVASGFRVTATKTEHSNRRVNLGKVVHKRMLTLERTGPYVFSGEGVNSYQAIRRMFKEILKEAGLPELTLHATRHTACTLFLANGENPKVVSQMMGHKSVAFTLDRYTHLIPALSEGQEDRIDQLHGYEHVSQVPLLMPDLDKGIMPIKIEKA